jgi:Tfp pilus assembly protein PilF
LQIPAEGQLKGMSPKARDYYRQGLAFVYLFNYVDAIRSFRMALQIEPKFVLAYVQMAREYLEINGQDQAQAAIDQAKSYQLLPNVTDLDRKWLDAVSAIVSDPRGANNLTPANALRDFAPKDPEVLAFYVYYFGFDEPMLLKILKLNSKHVAAHHFLEHYYESQGKYDLAQQHGRDLISQAPKSWHAQHMLGHTLPMLGRWKEAEFQLGLADSLTRDWFKKENASEQDDWHFPHNLDLYGVVELKLGKTQKAEKLFAEECSIAPASQHCFSLLDFLLLSAKTTEALRVIDQNFWEQAYAPNSGALERQLYGEAQLAVGKTEVARAIAKEVSAANDDPSDLRMLNLRFELALLDGADATKQQQVAMAVQGALAGNSFDTWSRQLMAAERLAIFAAVKGYTELANNIVRSIHRIDPDYKIPMQG